MSEQDAALETNPWTTRIYPREAGFAGFDRLMNFTDAVYAIALTLAALEIGLPEIEGNANSPGALWSAIVEKGPKLGAFVVAFAWVAIYWRANHKFTATLRDQRKFTAVTLLYLAFVAILPWPAEMLGEYWGNPGGGFRLCGLRRLCQRAPRSSCGKSPTATTCSCCHRRNPSKRSR